MLSLAGIGHVLPFHLIQFHNGMESSWEPTVSSCSYAFSRFVSTSELRTSLITQFHHIVRHLGRKRMEVNNNEITSILQISIAAHLGLIQQIIRPTSRIPNSKLLSHNYMKPDKPRPKLHLELWNAFRISNIQTPNNLAGTTSLFSWSILFIQQRSASTAAVSFGPNCHKLYHRCWDGGTRSIIFQNSFWK